MKSSSSSCLLHAHTHTCAMHIHTHAHFVCHTPIQSSPFLPHTFAYSNTNTNTHFFLLWWIHIHTHSLFSSGQNTHTHTHTLDRSRYCQFWCLLGPLSWACGWPPSLGLPRVFPLLRRPWHLSLCVQVSSSHKDTIQFITVLNQFHLICCKNLHIFLASMLELNL